MPSNSRVIFGLLTRVHPFKVRTWGEVNGDLLMPSACLRGSCRFDPCHRHAGFSVIFCSLGFTTRFQELERKPWEENKPAAAEWQWSRGPGVASSLLTWPSCFHLVSRSRPLPNQILEWAIRVIRIRTFFSGCLALGACAYRTMTAQIVLFGVQLIMGATRVYPLASGFCPVSHFRLSPPSVHL